MSANNITEARTLDSKDGTTLYAEAVGDRTKPHILMAHALACDCTGFDNIFNDETYQNQLYMVRFDMRGHGRSDKPPTIDDYASERQAEDVAAVVDVFGLKNFFLAGWSLGAVLAADIATYISPNPLAGLIYIAALPYIGPIMGAVGTPAVLSLLPSMLLEDAATAFSTRAKFVDLFTPHFGPPISYKVKNEWIGITTRQSPAVAGFVTSRQQDPAALLKAGKEGLPLLVLNGKEDQIVSGPAVIDAIKPDFPHLEAKLLGGYGHALCFEAPKDVGDAIVSFVGRVLSK